VRRAQKFSHAAPESTLCTGARIKKKKKKKRKKEKKREIKDARIVTIGLPLKLHFSFENATGLDGPLTSRTRPTFFSLLPLCNGPILLISH
jgi:hypothetical protein